jgi:uncharacterized protein YajQ (UPF0234 family)
LIIKAKGEDKLEAAVGILQTKLLKRGVPLKAIEMGKIEGIPGGALKQVATLQQGIPVEKGRDIAKMVKDSKLKVQASIQGDELRVSGKARDDLQTVMQLLRGHDFGVDLQFGNFRD